MHLSKKSRIATATALQQIDNNTP